MTRCRAMGLLAVAAWAAGCGGADPAPKAGKKMTVRLEDVPASVMDIAKKELGKEGEIGEYQTFKKLEPDGKAIKGFEVKGRRKSDGKWLELMVAPDGRVLEREY